MVAYVIQPSGTICSTYKLALVCIYSFKCNNQCDKELHFSMFHYFIYYSNLLFLMGAKSGVGNGVLSCWQLKN